MFPATPLSLCFSFLPVVALTLLSLLYTPATLALFQVLQYGKGISTSQPLHTMPLFVGHSSVHPSHTASPEYFQNQLKFYL